MKRSCSEHLISRQIASTRGSCDSLLPWEVTAALCHNDFLLDFFKDFTKIKRLDLIYRYDWLKIGLWSRYFFASVSSKLSENLSTGMNNVKPCRKIACISVFNNPADFGAADIEWDEPHWWLLSNITTFCSWPHWFHFLLNPFSPMDFSILSIYHIYGRIHYHILGIFF